MGRWLAPLLPGPQHWVLHDRDAELLEIAAARPPGPAADGSRGHRARPDTRTWPGCPRTRLAGAAVVTASALLDMLTVADLSELVAACAGRGCPVLLTLSVIGQVGAHPRRATGRALAVAFNAHQRRSRSTAGCSAPTPPTAPRRSSRRRREVVRPSPWRLDARNGELIAEWLTGWVAAACEQEPALAGRPTTTPPAGSRNRRGRARGHRRATPTSWCCPVGSQS